MCDTAVHFFPIFPHRLPYKHHHNVAIVEQTVESWRNAHSLQRASMLPLTTTAALVTTVLPLIRMFCGGAVATVALMAERSESVHVTSMALIRIKRVTRMMHPTKPRILGCRRIFLFSRLTALHWCFSIGGLWACDLLGLRTSWNCMVTLTFPSRNGMSLSLGLGVSVN